MSKEMIRDVDKGTPLSQVKGIYWISRKYKVIFLNIPKSASTSIKGILRRNGFEESVKLYTNEAGEGYKVFAVLRHPFRRFVSAYHTALKRGIRTNRKDILLHVPAGLPKVSAYFYALRDDPPFDEHGIPQTYFISDTKGKLFSVDKYMICERLQLDLVWLEKVLKKSLYTEYVPTNKGETLSKTWDAVLTDKKLVREINNYYKADWELYNEVLEG
jgi:hypothetical protein